MAIEAAFMVPHPPMIVPEVGKGSEKQVQKTIDSYKRVAEEIAAIKPETIIISSPHSVMYYDYFHISPKKGARGDFGRFGAAGVSFDEKYDTELVSLIEKNAGKADLQAGTMGEKDPGLDHGTMVPLFFIRQKYTDFRIVRIGLSGLDLPTHYELGMIIKKSAEELGRRCVYIASGDLSHKLQDYGPYGFAKEGPEYDKKIMDTASRAAFGEMLEFDEGFCEKAAECGHRSFVIMAGALDGCRVKAKVYSHEDVTGVGYGICSFYPETGDDGKALAYDDRRFLDIYLKKESARLNTNLEKSDGYVKIARKTIDRYIRTGKTPKADELAPLLTKEEISELTEKRAGVFVSIHEHGALRGCIGTILPTASSIMEEIVQNAVSASTNDPRFEPIDRSELPYLEINVDVLTSPEPIDSPDELDVKRYGVIVTCGSRRGLLLPDLEGVDTVEEQISIAMSKGGIQRGEDYRLERFEVIRHK